MITRLKVYGLLIICILTCNGKTLGQSGLTSPVNLQVKFDDTQEDLIHIYWEHDTTGSGEFLGFDLYENGESIIGGLLNDTSFTKTLQTEGTYIYEAEAVYYDGYSDLSNRGIITYSETRNYNFSSGNGNALSDTWTIYLKTGTLGTSFLSPGDELAIFDGDLLVGKMHLKQQANPEVEGMEALIAFTQFSETSGYTPGNAFTFQLYDASMLREYDNYTLNFIDDDPNAYTGVTFPDEESFSILEINFEPELNEPQNIATATSRHDVTISWTNNSSRDIIGYNIYRNNTLLNNSPYASTTYLDENVISGNYEYFVTAVYDEGTSIPSEIAPVYIDLVHFDPVESPPLNPMAVVIESAEIMNQAITTLDEIAAFKNVGDETICINAISLKMPLESSFDTLWLSQDNANTDEIEGFSDGDTLFFRAYDYELDKEYSDMRVSFPTITPDTSRIFVSNGITHNNLSWMPYAPINLSTEVLDYDILLSWEEHTGNNDLNLQGYKIYRNDVVINPDLILANNYLDTNLLIDTYAYNVEAVYEQALSYKSETISQNIASQFFTPIQESNSPGNMHFSVFRSNIDNNPLTNYDQVGVFCLTQDELICIGAGSIRDSATINAPLSFTAFKDNPDTPEKDGFLPGDSIYYKFWDESTDLVYSELQKTFPEQSPSYHLDYFNDADTCHILLDFTTPPSVKFFFDAEPVHCTNSTSRIFITTQDFNKIDTLSMQIEFEDNEFFIDSISHHKDFLNTSSYEISENLATIMWHSEARFSANQNDTLFTLYISPLQDVFTSITWGNASTAGGMEYQNAIFQDNEFLIERAPSTPSSITGDEGVCNGTAFSTYQILEIDNAENYLWQLSNTNAGDLESDNNFTNLFWSNDFEGTVEISVQGQNNCGLGFASTKLVEIVNSVNTSVEIMISEGTDCEGQLIEISANTTNGGNNPLYDWYINDEIHFQHTQTISSDHFVNDDEVYCIMLSSSECVMNNPATSQTIEFALDPLPDSPGSIIGPTNICNTTGTSYYTTSGGQNADDYLWQINPADQGEIISNGNNAEVHWNAETFGMAYISVMSVNSCGTSPLTSFQTFRDYCTENQNLTNQITIYPNPARETIHILGIQNTEEALYRLYNLNGTLIDQGEIDLDEYQLSVGNLNPGAYLLHIYSDQFNIRRKILKQ